MKGIAKTVLAAVLAVGLAGAAHAQTASKKLVVYCPHPLVFIEPIVKKFEAATGIQTEVVAAGTGELLKRIEAESSNPLGDVMWGGTLSVLDPSKKFFEAYRSPEASALVDEAKVADDKMTGFTLVPSVIRVALRSICNSRCGDRSSPSRNSRNMMPIWAICSMAVADRVVLRLQST